MKKAVTFMDRVLAAVRVLGECSPAQVAALVSKCISAARAASDGRIDARHSLRGRRNVLHRGRLKIVRSEMCRLVKTGKLRRLRHGTYTLPAPTNSEE